MTFVTPPRSASFVYVESVECGQSRVFTMIKSTLPLLLLLKLVILELSLVLPSPDNSFLETEKSESLGPRTGDVEIVFGLFFKETQSRYAFPKKVLFCEPC